MTTTTKAPTAAHSARVHSVFQQDIFLEAQNGKGHIVVASKPGSGKTTTMLDMIEHLPQGARIVMLAFSNKIKEELIARAPDGVTVMGLNSLGMRACLKSFGKVDVKEEKTPTIIESLIERRLPRYLAALLAEVQAERDPEERRILQASFDDEKRMYQRTAHKIVGLCKATLAMKPEEISAMFDDRAVELPSDTEEDRAEFIKLVRLVLEISYEERKKWIDYDDQIWLPIVLNMTLPEFDYVLIDEVQDLSRAQIKMILRVCKPKTGRIFAFGDKNQCIFSFRGADYRTMDDVQEALSAKVMPLSVCYRCARLIVLEAKAIVPDIEAAPNAVDGVVRRCKVDKMLEDVQPGDFILSRENSALVAMCMELIRENRPAVIAGDKSMSDRFLTMMRRSRARTVAELETWVDKWVEAEVEKLERKGRDPKDVEDSAACMHVLCEGAETISEVKARIASMFSETSSESRIILSSVHKAKGLERNRAFLLSWTFQKKKGGPKKNTDAKPRREPTKAELIEEKNLLYVAITRAKKELVYVDE